MIDVWADKTAPRISLEDYEKNIIRMIREFQKKRMQVVLMTPPPMVMTDELRDLYGKPPYTENDFNFMLAQYKAKLKEIALVMSVELIDIDHAIRQAATKEEQLLDFLREGMHPNQRGDDLIAATIEESLRGLIIQNTSG